MRNRARSRRCSSLLRAHRRREAARRRPDAARHAQHAALVARVPGRHHRRAGARRHRGPGQRAPHRRADAPPRDRTLAGGGRARAAARAGRAAHRARRDPQRRHDRRQPRARRSRGGVAGVLRRARRRHRDRLAVGRAPGQGARVLQGTLRDRARGGRADRRGRVSAARGGVSQRVPRARAAPRRLRDGRRGGSREAGRRRARRPPARVPRRRRDADPRPQRDGRGRREEGVARRYRRGAGRAREGPRADRRPQRLRPPPSCISRACSAGARSRSSLPRTRRWKRPSRRP